MLIYPNKTFYKTYKSKLGHKREENAKLQKL